jgi:putative hemolysin
MSVLGQLAVILLLILINGFFSMTEIAIISARRARLSQSADEGRQGARAALALKDAPNNLLSTIQIGITLIGTLAGALGGASLSEPLARWLSSFGWLARHAQGVALALVVIGITFLTLVLGELVPKRIGLNKPEPVAQAVAPFMRAMAAALGPLVKLLGLSTELMLRLFRVRPSEEPSVTEDELRGMLAEGTQAGVFEEAEQDMVERILLLDDRRAAALMTPRPDIVWLDVEDSPEELADKLRATPYSRLPVGRGSLDNIMGEVRAKDLLALTLEGKPLCIEPVLRQPLYVPETMLALHVLEAFKQSGTEMALAIDEYGSVQGLISLTDILEAIVGDIPSDDEPEEPEAVRREDGSWLVDGMLPVDEFKELLGISELPDEELGYFQTLAGFVMVQLGHLPATTDLFDWGGWRFEVMDMDGPRVDKILVSITPDRSEAPGPMED